MRTSGGKGILGRRSIVFKSPPVYSLCERVSWAGTQTARPRALPLADTTAAGCFLREAEGIDVPVCMIPDINTHVMPLGSNASKLVSHRGSTC